MYKEKRRQYCIVHKCTRREGDNMVEKCTRREGDNVVEKCTREGDNIVE
jgi:hypothetical protein